MTLDTIWERAIGRYADRVYRLALLRDPQPERAAQATTTAFRTLDWTSAELDDMLEGRLLAALAPVRRTRRKATLPGIRAVFWRLSPQMRFALGLRLTRGYDADAISSVLNWPVDDLRRQLIDAIALLAGDADKPLRDECRRSRIARLDEHGADRAHQLNCADCQAAGPRWEQTEHVLGEEIVRVISVMSLPRPVIEDLRSRLRGGTPQQIPAWRRPALLQVLVIICVIAAVMFLVIPRRNTQTAGRSPTTARDLLVQAIERYGAAPRRHRGVTSQL